MAKQNVSESIAVYELTNHEFLKKIRTPLHYVYSCDVHGWNCHVILYIRKHRISFFEKILSFIFEDIISRDYLLSKYRQMVARGDAVVVHMSDLEERNGMDTTRVELEVLNEHRHNWEKQNEN